MESNKDYRNRDRDNLAKRSQKSVAKKSKKTRRSEEKKRLDNLLGDMNSGRKDYDDYDDYDNKNYGN
jgi:hypothetical protein